MNKDESEIMRAVIKEKLTELINEIFYRGISKEGILPELLPVKITFDSKNCIITDGLNKELLKIDITSVVWGRISTFCHDTYAKFYFEVMDGDRLYYPFPNEQDVLLIEKSDITELKKYLKNLGYRIVETNSSEILEIFYFVQERKYGILKNTIFTKSATNK